MHYSIAQLLNAPGLPTSRQAIARMAERETWTWISNPGQGGGKLYALNALPDITQLFLMGMTTPSIGGCILSTTNSQGGTATTSLSTERVDSAARFDVKSILLDRLDRMRDEMGIKLTGARKLFVEMFNTGKILGDYHIRRAVRRLSLRSLQRWEKTARRSAASLGGRYGNRRGVNQIDNNPILLEACLANLHLSAAEIRRQIKICCPFENLPSRTTVWRWLNNFKHNRPADYAIIVDPQKYLDKYQPRVGDLSENITQKNEMWMIDATILDEFASNNQRYVLLQLIDVFSRRKVSHLCETSSSEEVAILLRKAVLKFGGIPKYLKLDNGMEFKSHHISTSSKELGIEQYFCRPFSPWEKGQIERSFGTLNNYLKTLSGYCGHNTVERQKIVKREGKIEGKLTWAELSTLIDQYWIDEEMNHVHTGIGMTPMEKWNTCFAPLRTVDIRQLDFALTPWYRRNPRLNKGILRINKHRYSSSIGAQISHEGLQVRVKFDPYVNGVIHCFDLATDEYLFDMTCPELVGESRIEHVRAIKAAEREQRKPLKTAVNRLRKSAQAKRDRAAKEAVDSVILKPETNLIPLVLRERENIAIYAEVATKPVLEVVKPRATRKLVSDGRQNLRRAGEIVEWLCQNIALTDPDRRWIEKFMVSNSKTFEEILRDTKRSFGIAEEVEIFA